MSGGCAVSNANYCVLCPIFSYLEKVLDYVSDYLDRVHPLLDQNSLYEEIEKEFEDKWLQGNFPGWRVSFISHVIKCSTSI